MLSAASATEPIDQRMVDVVARSSDYPNLRQVAPALSRMSEDDLFDLGVATILDGIDGCRMKVN